MSIANVTLNSTFDEWRLVTNQLSNYVNDVSNQQLIILGPSLANTARDQANLSFRQANASFVQANTARDNSNTANELANAGITQANVIYDVANTIFNAANSGFIQANTARDHANAAFSAANSGVSSIQAFAQANTARNHANAAFSAANAASINSATESFIQANTARNHANAAFSRANVGFSNTSGSSFVGNIQIPTGNLSIGEGTTQGIRLHVNAWIGLANIYPQIKAAGGTQFINLNANTNFGGWNDLMLDRDLSIIFSKGTSDDEANLVIGPWTDSSFGYKQDGQGRHGFNTSNPRYVLDANGTANISGSLLVGTMNIVPTTTSSFAQANTARDHANASFLAANTGLGLGAAFAQANTARVQANTARDHANAAFLQANTALSGAGSKITEDSLDSTRYITFTDKTTGSLANSNVSVSLTYNPSTGTLSSTLFNSTSDINKKNNITIITDAIAKTEQLNGVRFTWKESGHPSAGLIAQDLIKVLPELVASDMSVTYSGVIGLLVEAIKELNERVKKLENK